MFAPTPASARPGQHPVLHRDPAGKCDPLQMPNPNQGLIEAPGEGGCLPGMIAVAGFCIDRYEGRWCRPTAATPFPFFNPGVEICAPSPSWAPSPGLHRPDPGQPPPASPPASASAPTPSGCVPVRAQGHTYPYGDVPKPGVCNDARAVAPGRRVLRHGPIPRSSRSSTTRASTRLPDSLDPTGAARLRDGRGRLRHDGQPPRVDATTRGDVPRRVLLRGHREERPGCFYDDATARTTRTGTTPPDFVAAPILP